MTEHTEDEPRSIRIPDFASALRAYKAGPPRPLINGLNVDEVDGWLVMRWPEIKHHLSHECETAATECSTCRQLGDPGVLAFTKGARREMACTTPEQMLTLYAMGAAKVWQKDELEYELDEAGWDHGTLAHLRLYDVLVLALQHASAFQVSDV